MNTVSDHYESHVIEENSERYNGIMEYFGTLSPASSAVDSQESSSNYASPHSFYGMSPPSSVQNTVFDCTANSRLIIREQPVEKFRFRYKSEMNGAHGSLNGRNSERSKKVSYPTVVLVNYNKKAIVRCTLYSVNEGDRMVHPHRLVSGDNDDPHEREVGPDIGYEAEFANMGIIHTARKFVKDELIQKKKRILQELKNAPLSMLEKNELQNEVSRDAKAINLNTVCLCFEAFYRTPTGQLEPICDKVFSEPINNRKSAMTGELKICRMDKTVSDCTGGEEVFILVEKVVKRNIKVRLFEYDEDDESITWMAEGLFNELDVHHQYAIVFKTPPYKDTKIDKPVKVFIQLYRPSDAEISEPIEFYYKPVLRTGTKRGRYDSNLKLIPTTLESMNSINSLELINVSDNNEIENGLQARQILGDTADQLDSDEFNIKVFWNQEFMQQYRETLEPDDKDMLVCDGSSSRKPKHTSLLKTILNRAHQDHINGETLAEKVIGKLNAQIQLNHDQVPKLLEEVFSMRSADGDSALHTSIRYFQKNYLRTLLRLLGKNGSTEIINCVNNAGETALHCAVRCGYPTITETLLFIGADPNIKDIKGETALHAAIKLDFKNNIGTELVEVLLNKGKIKSEIDVINYDGYTALQLAVKCGNLDVVKILMQHGFDPNRTISVDGSTTVHLAVKENQKEILKYLLNDEKTDVNKQDYKGDTALHIAVADNNKDMCYILHQYNANPDIANFMASEVKTENGDDDDNVDEEEIGFTSLELAANNKEILHILKSEPNSPCANDRTNESRSSLFDDTCLNELSSIIDHTPLLTNLVEMLECEQCLSYFTRDTSSTKILLNYAQVVNGQTIDQIRNILEALDAVDAVRSIDNMKKRQSLMQY